MSQSPPVRTGRGRPKGTGAQRVFDALRDDILRLRLKPGAHIEEAALEKRFKVSRTPVREALIRLAAAGLVTLLPNRGAQVAQIDISEVPQFFEALDICQRLVLRLAGVRRNDDDLARLDALNGEFAAAAKRHDVVAMSEINHDFHVAMGAACGNKYVRELYEDLLSVGLRLARSAFTTGLTEQAPERGYYDEVVGQHRDMIDAIRRQDADAGEALGRAHTDLFRGRLVRAMEANLSTEFDLGAPEAES
jgi:DNA-binding GntR family transcriptional regulator